MQGFHRKIGVSGQPQQQRAGTPGVPKSARQTPRDSREDSAGGVGGSHATLMSPVPFSGQRGKANVAQAGAASSSAQQRKSPVPPPNLRRSPVTVSADHRTSGEGKLGGGASKTATPSTRTFLKQGVAGPSAARGAGLAFSTQVTPRTPEGKGGFTPRMVGRHEGGWNPSVIVNPNFDFAVRHQASSSVATKTYSGEEGGLSQAEGWTSRLSSLGDAPRARAAGAAGGGSGSGSGSRRSGPMCGGGAFSSIKMHQGWPQGGDGGLLGLSDADLMDDNQIESAIQLLQQHKDLQQDQVLQDLLTMIKKRTHNNQVQQRAARETSRSMSMMRSDGEVRGVDEVERGEGGAERSVFGMGSHPFTSDSSTQVHTVEAASQTELCEFKEKKMRPKHHRPREGLSYSDSDVPSEATGSEHNYLSMPGNGRRRRASLGGDSVSLETSSPRESIDGINDSCYSRDVSDASGPNSVYSTFISAASSTDASQGTTTLGDSPAKPVRKPKEKGVQKGGAGAGRGGGLNVAVPQEDEERIRGAYDADADEADVLNNLFRAGLGGIKGERGDKEQSSPVDASTGPSPPPCIETILEMHLLLEQMYRKIGVTGPVLYPPSYPLPSSTGGGDVRPICRTNGIFSPATDEMRRLTIESLHLSDDATPVGLRTSPADRPPNPVGDVDGSWRTDLSTFHPSEDVRLINESTTRKGVHVRMGNSPPKHVRPVPPISIPSSQPSPLHTPRPRDSSGVESPLSTPRDGSAFLAHFNNSARSSATNGSLSSTSTPRLMAHMSRHHHTIINQ